MGLFEKVASGLGVGQQDIKDVFHSTIERVDRAGDVMTAPWRDGAKAALICILKELKDRDVISGGTFKELSEDLDKWHGKSAG